MNRNAVLISAPFGPLNLPSIGLTLLKGVADTRGFSSDICYLGMDFAQCVGVKFYNSISAGYPSNTTLAGEFLFATYFYGKSDEEIEGFFAQHLFCENKDARPSLAKQFGDASFHQQFLSDYRNAIARIPEWVVKSARMLAGRGAQVYGFTSMFQQNMGSLAVAKMLKQLRPECLIIFGGPNCERPMGDAMLEEFRFIDMICSGEGEDAFVSVLEFIKSNGATKLHSNIRCAQIQYCNKNGSQEALQQQRTNLELLPPPDYDDYFFQLSLLPHSNDDISARVLLETSRGCWWGERSHCSFCGLNGASLAFRSKSPEKALSEIRVLRNKYPTVAISVVDNIIDYKYFKTLLPLLSQENINIELFYETKANLTKTQLRMMRSAGISRIQPGIESLSSSVLKLMRKGVKAIQNVCLLKWCAEEGIKPEWNFLWGFPDENPEDYEEMASLVQYLRHLMPPNASARIRLDRFSPLYENRANEPIENVKPHTAYFSVYSISESRLNDLAYYFTFDYKRQLNVASYTSALDCEIEKWQIDYPKSYLVYSSTSNGVFVFDGRNKEKHKILQFPKICKHILQACEKPISPKSLMDDPSCCEDYESVGSFLKLLVQQGILLQIDDLLFNVAIELTAAQSYPSLGFRALVDDLIKLDSKESEDAVVLEVHHVR